MQHNPIGWVEIPVTDLDRAEKFYGDFFTDFTFERQPEKNGWTMSWFMPMEMEKYGAAATLMKGEGYVPSHEGPMIYFPAPTGSLDEALKRAQEQEIQILCPKVDIGEHGFFAVLQDSEGNRIAIHSMQE